MTSLQNHYDLPGQNAQTNWPEERVYQCVGYYFFFLQILPIFSPIVVESGSKRGKRLADLLDTTCLARQ